VEDALRALVGALLIAVFALARVVWRLSERVARVEGRLNGKEPPRR